MPGALTLQRGAEETLEALERLHCLTYEGSLSRDELTFRPAPGGERLLEEVGGLARRGTPVSGGAICRRRWSVGVRVDLCWLCFMSNHAYRSPELHF